MDWCSALLYEEAGYADDHVRMTELAKIQLLEQDGEDLQRPASGLRENGSEVEKPVVPGKDRQ